MYDTAACAKPELTHDIENKNSSSDCQILPPLRELLLQSNYPRSSRTVTRHLQRYEESCCSKLDVPLGSQHPNLASNSRSDGSFPVRCTRSCSILGLCARRPQKGGESWCLLHNVCRVHLHRQYCHLGCRGRHFPERQEQRRRKRSLGLGV